MDIPNNWTFKSDHVAKQFDQHVREQLPWYDLATRAVALVARHYIPKRGLVYDIGASTGNIGRALQDTIQQREASFIPIEESEEMAAQYHGPGKVVVADALEYQFAQFDFAVCFLSLMFFPVGRRSAWLQSMRSLIRPGGAMVVVDKVCTPPGYAGTVLRRMAMQWKLDSGTPPDQIVAKELSLAGYQRPLRTPGIAEHGWVQFFAFGEFSGWIIERPE